MPAVKFQDLVTIYKDDENIQKIFDFLHSESMRFDRIPTTLSMVISKVCDVNCRITIESYRQFLGKNRNHREVLATHYKAGVLSEL